ncbi:response regulator [Leptospira gomenensis]|uniref:Response regulator n=1 Tax=Leptospira gomenensis TaxID=2484974 RepID=A0A5F1YDR0_9LEPT|nr:response regulator [Leptospira gomenensis]TGK36076.1 response regulator [Leptospira gomenensis]TGK40085.1 response regulator [Leptospira gomenensis]TGK51560.1 response regulator [Leptospira gomenensis]TGK68113.1 response regulator [Leptospira gomenensis]
MNFWLIDDDSIYIMIAKRFLEKDGRTKKLRDFQDGEIALQQLQSLSGDKDELPDAILLDINMPFMDGWQFLDEFKKIRGDLAKNVKIFMVSSSVDERDIVKANSFPEVKGYLSKPLTQDHIQKLYNDLT